MIPSTTPSRVDSRSSAVVQQQAGPYYPQHLQESFPSTSVASSCHPSAGIDSDSAAIDQVRLVPGGMYGTPTTSRYATPTDSPVFHHNSYPSWYHSPSQQPLGVKSHLHQQSEAQQGLLTQQPTVVPHSTTSTSSQQPYDRQAIPLSPSPVNGESNKNSTKRFR